MSPGSIMPAFPWLLTQNLDTTTTAAKIKAMRSIGVPYPEGYETYANEDLIAQADSITTALVNAGVPAKNNKEIIALIAYLQRLGTDIKVNKQQVQK